MNVLLISQCDKRALVETRRILDQFGERRGDRTWQTPITQDGLDTLRRLLRKTARKNTAVACHRIRGADQSELMWVVGDRRRFNAQGAVPTNTTTRDVLRAADENQWHAGELIQLLTDLSGLLHDLGKSIDQFQQRLRAEWQGRNAIRHEWVSLRLFEAFVGADGDAAWLARLAQPTADDDARWLSALKRDGIDAEVPSPFRSLRHAPLASAIGWLVVSHHRLPDPGHQKALPLSELTDLLSQAQPTWIEEAYHKAKEEDASLQPYWSFPQGLPVTSQAWRRRASRVARRLGDWLARQGEGVEVSPMSEPFVMHLSRLSLMLADHHYSSLPASSRERVLGDAGFPLWANTGPGGRPNQSLDEHLVGVAQHGAEVARFLPRVASGLPGLGRVGSLRKRSTVERFQWQDRAADLATGFQPRAAVHGAFIVNMASTGCGKTLANAKIMSRLADPDTGWRCAFALGLRTLTLQTGKAFRGLMKLDDEELAIRAGGSASRALFEYHQAKAEDTGSASSQKMLDEDAHVDFDGDTEGHPLLRRAVADPDIRRLLVAPLLVCTIDHLTPATESLRGGRQIAPMLRLMSSDLVLDEPDDFDLADLPALTRLVHWAGLLGSRVLLSSATLPPALVQGLFEAYRDGRTHFQRHCGARPEGAGAPPQICCAWVDESEQVAHDCPDAATFAQAHERFAGRRHAWLAAKASDSSRRAALLVAPPAPVARAGARPDVRELAQAWAACLLDAAVDLHRNHHDTDALSGRRVSFGLIRLANISVIFELALAMFKANIPEGVRIHLCVYHSRHPALVRSALERQLDAALTRHQPDAVFQLPEIRERVATGTEQDQIFIVLGSPVTEVGRDHCYDWAVVEPSSMRSLIQLAGRVMRHRQAKSAMSAPNVLVLDRNVRHFTQPGRAAFCRPGFESEDPRFRLASHDLHQLIREDELPVIDARPRLVPASPLMPNQKLSDLEHARLAALMLQPVARPVAARTQGLVSRARRQEASSPVVDVLNAATWWRGPAGVTLSAAIQRAQPFREEQGPADVCLVLLPDEDEEECVIHGVIEQGRRGEKLYVTAESRVKRLPDSEVQGVRIQAWTASDYMSELRPLAEARGMSLRVCAQRLGTVDVPEDLNGWRYHPVLGFSKVARA